MENKEKKSGKVCESCLKIKTLKELYWVERTNYKSLHCIDCIEENKLIAETPYVTPRKKKN